MIATLTKEQADYLCEQFGLKSIAEIHPEQLDYIAGHLEKLAKIKEAEAEERGARRLAEYIVNVSEHPATSVEHLMAIWRTLR